MAKISKNSLVIIPAPGLGHLIPTLEFAHTLLRRDARLSITFLVINPPFKDTGFFTNKLSPSHPALNFIDIARIDPSPLLTTPPMSLEAFYSSYIELHKVNVKEAVEKLVLPTVAGSLSLVTDMFCTSMIDVANELNTPCYTFFTSNAAFLGFLKFITAQSESKFSETNTYSMIRIPCYVNPVPIAVLPSFVFHKDGHKAFSTHAKRIKEMDGVIVNTFADLEQHPLSCLSDDEGFPPVYPVGPLIDLTGANQILEMKEAEKERVLRWLGEQEDETVVFLCFGSMGSFKAEQVMEIAVGLENSGVKFLWSLRKPPREGPIEESPEELDDPREILPDGFLKRIQGRGLICGWAPQVSILAHQAVGGFVTHCGWNSILESIWFGIPTLAWPLYGEQQINAFGMVMDLCLSVELKMSYKLHQKDLVTAAEIESAIRELMYLDGMRRRVKEMSERSRLAVAEGGTSFERIGELIRKME